MLQRDRNTLDLTQQTLQLASDVLVWPVREQGAVVYRLEISKLHRFFRVGYEEYIFLSLLDGRTTIPQACGLAAAKLGGRAPTDGQAKAIARWLLENELAHLASDPPPSRRPRPLRRCGPSHPLSALLQNLNPFWMKFSLPRAERWINDLAGWLSPIFAARSVLLGVVVMFVATLVLLLNWTEFIASATVFQAGNWAWLLATWLALKLVHELAHAIACRRQGGSVRETGLVFVLLAPLAYVDVSSCWRMPSRSARIWVSSAGMYIELLIAAVAILWWAAVESAGQQFLLQNLIAAAGLSTILFNANVLMRFDGYYILADLVEVPNLYAEGSNSVTRALRRCLTGEIVPEGTLTGWRRSFVFAYGIAALLFRVTICASLVVASSVMFAGAGILIAGFGIAVWLGRPLSRLLAEARILLDRSEPRFARATCLSAAMLGSLAWLLVSAPIPTSVSAPAVVQYRPETVVRARSSGFIRAIDVADGDRVKQGQRLIQLENRQLSNELAAQQITRRQNEIRIRQATGAHDASRLQILQATQRSIDTRLAQLGNQVASLCLTAPRDGIVIARNLPAKLGTYVNEGNALMVVAGDSDKEIIALVHHDQVDKARRRVGSGVDVHPRGFGTIEGRLDQVEPRAVDALTLPALSAAEGGPLATRATEQPGQPRLLAPHFRARVGLAADQARRIPAGLRTEIWLGYRTESAYHRVHQRLARWWYAAADQ